MPLPALTKRIDLGEVGAEEFWVEFLRIPGMKYGRALELFGERARKSEKEIDEREIAKRRFSELILNWNIENGDGEVLPLPADDPEVIFELPNVYVDYISEQLALDAAGGTSLDLQQRKEISSLTTT